MRKLYFGLMTFLYIIILSKIGSGQSWSELIQGIINRTPTDITSLFMSLAIALIVYLRTNNKQKKITILNIVSIIVLAGLFYSSNIDDKNLENKRTYQIINDLSAPYTIKNRLVLDSKTSKYITGKIQILKQGTNKLNYEISFRNGVAIKGFRYQSDGSKKELTDAHLYNMGLRTE